MILSRGAVSLRVCGMQMLVPQRRYRKRFNPFLARSKAVHLLTPRRNSDRENTYLYIF
jgi:hypothetical protein